MIRAILLFLVLAVTVWLAAPMTARWQQGQPEVTQVNRSAK